MPPLFRIYLCAVFVFLALLVQAEGAVVNATWNAATDVPVTASSYNATGNTVNLTLNFAPATGANLTVVNNTGAGFIGSAFDNLTQGQAVTLSYNGVSYNFVANYYGGTGNDLVLVWAVNRVFAWGDNSYGQIGDGTGTQRNLMVPMTATGVLAGKTVVALSQGVGHNLMLCSDGTLVACGSGYFGGLGNNTNASSTVPVLVSNGNGLSALYGKVVVGMAAGNDFSLAVCSDGTVASWGFNTKGQLGSNSTTNTNAPVLVNTASGTSALYGKTVVAVAAGSSHSVALCSDGTVAAWGYNGSGQLGNSTTTDSLVPVAVNTASGISALYGKTVVSIAAGGDQTLALCSDGTLVAWGSGADSLGNSKSVPTEVSQVSGVSALYGKTVTGISVGNYSKVALCSDGTVVTWGSNSNGQLGNNSTTDSPLPVLVNTDSGTSFLYGKTVVGIAASINSFRALCADGTMAAWGFNAWGQYGNNTTTSGLVPVQSLTTPLNSGERVVNASGGANGGQALVLVAEPLPVFSTGAATLVGGTSASLTGTVNASGGLPVAVSFEYGLTTAYGSSVAGTPASVTGSSDTAVSAALTGLVPNTTYHFRVKGAGYNGSDRTFTTLNNDARLVSLTSTAGALSPSFVSGTYSYAAPSVGAAVTSVTVTPTLSDSTASLMINGVTATSGSPSTVNLDYGATPLAVQVTAQDGVTKLTYTITFTRSAPATIAATYASASDVPFTTNGFTATGKTVSLALNYAPVTGTNLTVVNNTGLPFISGTFSNLSQGQAVTLTYNGVGYGFVANYYGGTGNDLVLTWAGHRVFDWGDNTYGQIGDGTVTQRNVMVPVTATGVLSGKTILALSQSTTHCVALCSDGSVASWGSNTYGTLGNGNTTLTNYPVAVSAALGASALYGKTVVAVSSGNYYTLALCSDGKVVSWGYNASGQLGINSTTSSNVPVLVNTTSGTSALFGKTVVAVATGDAHSVALCSDGTVAAWGLNSSGQLGNNSTSQSLVPVAVNTASGVSALYGKTVVAISAGGDSTMALCSDGTVAAWGAGSSGQLGNGGTTLKNVPVAVSTASGVSALYGKTVTNIASGASFGMALCADGTLAAWGYNTTGQLGNNSTTGSNVPVLVSMASVTSALYGKTVVAISVRGGCSTALCSDGTVATWGYNGYGQLANNTTTNSLVPQLALITPLGVGERVMPPSAASGEAQSLVLVAQEAVPPTATTVAATSLGSSTATLNGTVNAGSNSTTVSFEYGTTTAYGTTVAGSPATATGSGDTAVSAALSGLAAMTTYHFRAKGVSATGAAVGSDQTFTTLSNNASLASLTTSAGALSPSFASGTTSYSTASVSETTTSITVTPTLSDSNATVTVNGVSVSSGSPSAAVSLGYGSNVINVQVTAQDGVTKQTYALTVPRSLPAALAATYSSATDVPLTVNGLTATGSTVNFTLNYAPATGTNLMVVNNTGLPFISGTFDNLAQGQPVALSYNGTTYNYIASYYGGTGNDLVLVWAVNRAFAWGDNGYGQVGDGTTTQRNAMVPVTATGVLAGKTLMALVQGNAHSMALCSDGTVATWGLNSSGHLGNNSTSSSAVPVAVNTVSGTSALYGKTVVAIAAGNDHCLALCSDGTVAAWGSNVSGQLGDNTTTQRKVPVSVNTTGGISALAGKSVVAISAGGVHSMALCSDGTVVAWGDNSYGQLGNSTTTNSPVPLAVLTDSSSALYGKNIVSITAGSAQSMALSSDGTVITWGNNSNGQLGDNTTTQRKIPVAVNATSGVSSLFGKTVVGLAGGNQFSMALCSDGTVSAWGYNLYGQLGINSTTQSNVPVAVSTASGVSALYGKTVVTMAVAGSYRVTPRVLCADGSLAAWGNGGTGNLGSNSTSNSLVPVAVITTALAAGERVVSPGSSANTAPSMVLVAAPPPAAATVAATSFGSSTATLNGTVNAGGSTTTVSFEYGATTAYGTTVAGSPATATGSGDTAVSAALSGLAPMTTYHFRVKGVSATGTAAGSDQTFTTLSNNASLASLTTSAGALSPSFASGTTSYSTASVSETTTSITVTPTLSDNNATVTVNGVSVSSGSPSAAVSLGYGSNVINVQVTAQDGVTKQTYDLTVPRALPAALAATYSSATDVPLTVNGFTATGKTVNFTLNYAPATGTNLMVVNNTGLPFISGTFDNLAQGQPVVLSYNGVTYGFVADYYGGTGNDLVLVWAANRAFAWGDNTFGQVGDGTSTNRTVMVPVRATGVLAGKTIVALAQGSMHRLALCSDGTLAAWGYNFSGQLGINSTSSSAVPVAVNTASGLSALYGKTVVGISAGYNSSMALCSDGSIACWGDNTTGQLGDGTTTQRNVPVLVSTASGTSALDGKSVVAICAGGSHSLALCADGALVGWGSNASGQLGNNTTTSSSVPVLVSAASGVSALYNKTVAGISAGGSFSMALCTDGALVAWGSNSYGQLGINSTTSSSVPVLVSTASGVSALYNKTVASFATGGTFSLALCTDGSVISWGSNSYGELGINSTAQTTSKSLVPVAVNTASGTSALYVKTVVGVAVEAGMHPSARAVCADGTVAAWGEGGFGTLGNNNGNTSSLAPVLVITTPLAATERPVSPACGSNTAMSMILAASSLNNIASLAGLTTTAGSLSPAFAPGTTSYTAAVSTATSSVTVTPTVADSSATVTVNGVSTPSGSASAPLALSYGLNPILIKVTAQDGVNTQTYTLTVTRAVPTAIAATYASGSDVPVTVNGFTATGSTVNLTLGYAPVTGTSLTVVNNTSPAFISGTFGNLAQGQSVALTYNGIAYNFVANYYGGTGNDLVLVWARNRVFAWGQNNSGQIGDSSVSARSVPVAVTASGVLAGKTIVAVSRGAVHSLALCSDGTLAAWGDNTYGSLGDSTTTSRSVPVLVNTASGVSALYGKTVVAIAAGAYSSMALCSDGTVAAWGYNNYGQLGDSTTSTRTAPVAVNTASGVSALYGKTVTAIAAGGYHALALCSDGTVVTWGKNADGQLGNSTTTSSSVPVAANAAGGSALNGKTVLALAGGLSHSLVLCSDGSIVAWGLDDSDQLGVNGYTNYSTPVATSTASGTSALYGKTTAAISAGDNHSLAICTDGTLLAWGYNYYGQLGNNSTSKGFYPLAVNIDSGVSALYGKRVVGISGGASYTTVLCADGTLSSWGYNASGQLGNNSTTNSSVPVLTLGTALSAGERFVSLAAGCYASHELALVASPPAVPVATTLAATAVSGNSATLNGTVNASGSTTAVSFDYGTTTSYGTNVAATPASVSSSSSAAVSAAITGLSPLTTYHFRVSGTSGAGTGSGSDLTFTTLNNNATLSSLVPGSGTLTPAFAASTTAYTCTVPYATSSLTLTPGLTDSNASVKVNDITVASGSPSAALPLNVGDNLITVVVTAQDGATTQTYRITVTRQAFVLVASYTSASYVPLTTTGFTATGSTVNFSLNYAPATGTNLTVVNNTGLPFINGAFDNLAQGQAVTLTYGGKNYYYVANYYGGTGNDLVLMWASNRVFAWGKNDSGQLGDNTSTQRTIPTPVMATGVLADKTVIALSAGESHSLALCSDGTVVAWGKNSSGQLGNNTTTASTTPVVVSTDPGVSALAGKTVAAICAGGDFSMALCSDGTVVTWGSNYANKLGNNSSTQSKVPVLVNIDSGTSALYGKSVVAISAGYSHAVALCSDGTVATWGWNLFGQLGINSTTITTAPVPVAVSTDSGVSALYGKTVVAVAAGLDHTMVLCSDGSIAGWGHNYGDLGDNTNTQRYAPVAVNVTNGTSALYGKTPVSVAAGQGHSMALCSDGTVLTWGTNDSGQLGASTTYYTTSLAPIATSTSSGLSDLYGKTVAALSCGAGHSMARCTDGTLVTWGANGFGQLGNNSSIISSTWMPKLINTSQLNAGEVFASVSSGSDSVHTLALVAAPAQPICTTLAASPISYTGATMNGTVDANQATTTVSFDYGLTTAYGSNVAATPASLNGGTTTAVSAALTGLPMGTTYHYRVRAASAAGTTTGTDFTFTTNSSVAALSALAASTGTLTPAFATGTTSYTAAVPSTTGSLTLTPTSSDSTATVKINGTVIASGSTSPILLLGVGDNVFNVVVTSQDGATTKTYTLTVTRPGMALVAAYNSATNVPLTINGLSAAGSTVNFSLNYAPAAGANLTVVNNTSLSFISGTFDNLAQGQTVVMSYGGRNYTYVANYYGGTGNDLVLVWASNRVFGWGQNFYGQIGDSTGTTRTVPVPVVATGVLAGKTIIALSAGPVHSLALCSDGTVAAWGDNTNGQLGNNTITSSSSPVAVNAAAGVSALAGKTVVAISVGATFSLALCSDGTVAAWGRSAVGQLGTNSIVQRNVPTAVSTASGISALYGKSVVAISAGATFSVALCSDGTVVTWGSNAYGTLGNNTTADALAPVLVNTASGVSALYGKSVVGVASGMSHAMVLCSDGSLAGWGYNTAGELGDNTTTLRYAPVAVNAVNGTSALYGKTPVSIAAGYGFSLALCTDGSVLAWGYNISGQFGDTTTTSRMVPVAVNRASGVSDLYGKTVAVLSCGATHSMALCTDGTLTTWGGNSYGQLGVNSTTNSSVAKTVNTTRLNSGEVFAGVSSGGYASHALAVVATPPPFPVSTTLAASSVFNTTATFNGTVNASQRTTAVSFDYGLTTAYGSTVAATPDTLSDGTTTAVSAAVTGLTPGATYHFRVRASNDVGTVTGSDLTFTTLNSNAGLSALALNNGTLTPSFATGTTSYTATVAYPVTSITLRPTLADTNASVKVNGVTVASGSASAAIPLNVGTNTLTAVVTAQDGTTTQTYTVTVTRVAASTNAALAGLVPSVGSLSPAFASGTTSYTVTVPFSTSAISLTSTVADITATQRINGVTVASGSSSSPIGLSVGNNTLSTVVTAQDGITTQTYSITVVRPALPAAWNAISDVPLVTNGFTVGSNALGTLTLNFAPATGTNLMVIKNTGLSFISGTFSNLYQGQSVALVYNGVTYNFVANYYGGTGNDLVLQWAGNRAMAWGYNSDGELGDSSTTQRNTAVPVTSTGALAGKTILSLATGAKHSLALCSDGTLVAWGSNTSGQLGDTTTTDRLTPVAVNASFGVSALYGKTVIAIAAGQSHSLALCSDGTVAAWGENLYNQLGDTTTTQRNAPVLVNRSSGTSALFGKTVVAISAGARHNLALCSDGTVAAWGSNTSGQIGDNSTTPRSSPVAVNAASGVSALNGRSVLAVAAGGLHSLALCTDGAVLAWGNDVNGELGDDNAAQFYTSSPVAVLVKSSSGSALFGKSVVSIVAGYAHNLAQCSDGTLAAWGSNAFGQLGDTTTNSAYVPVTVSTASGVSALNGKTVAAIFAGARHSMAQCADGTLTAWGMGTSGQLGNSTITSSSAPVAVSGSPLTAGEVFVRAASGPYALHTVAIVAAPTPPPTVTSLAATGIGSTTAYLNATVNANGSITAVSFDYGTTTAYGSSVGDGYLGAVGSYDTSIIIQLTGLAPATTYHFRVKGASGAGTTTGSDLTFTTLSNDARLSSITLSRGTLSPAFSSDVLTYTTTVPSDTTSITFTPVLSDSNASVTLYLQSGATTNPVGITPGDTRIGLNVTAQDGTTRNYQVVVTRLSEVQNWRMQNFGTHANTGAAADAADFDGDGICNLLEYALNLSPQTASKLPASTAINNDNYEYTYTRSTAAVNAGVTFNVEWNATLSSATWSSSGVTQTVLSDDGTTQQVKAVIPMNAASRMFIHLSVTAPP